MGWGRHWRWKCDDGWDFKGGESWGHGEDGVVYLLKEAACALKLCARRRLLMWSQSIGPVTLVLGGLVGGDGASRQPCV